MWYMGCPNSVVSGGSSQRSLQVQAANGSGLVSGSGVGTSWHPLTSSSNALAASSHVLNEDLQARNEVFIGLLRELELHIFPCAVFANKLDGEGEDLSSNGFGEGFGIRGRYPRTGIN